MSSELPIKGIPLSPRPSEIRSTVTTTLSSDRGSFIPLEGGSRFEAVLGKALTQDPKTSPSDRNEMVTTVERELQAAILREVLEPMTSSIANGGLSGGSGSGVYSYFVEEALTRSLTDQWPLPSMTPPGQTASGAPPSSLEGMIHAAATEQNVPPTLLRAMVEVESGGNPRAVSSKGAQGLLQLMPGTAEEVGVDNPFDAEENLRGGANYLRQQLDRFGDVRKALAAYNAGPGAVAKYDGIPPYRETEHYVDRVLELERKFRIENDLTTLR